MHGNSSDTRYKLHVRACRSSRKRKVAQPTDDLLTMGSEAVSYNDSGKRQKLDDDYDSQVHVANNADKILSQDGCETNCNLLVPVYDDADNQMMKQTIPNADTPSHDHGICSTGKLHIHGEDEDNHIHVQIIDQMAENADMSSQCNNSDTRHTTAVDVCNNYDDQTTGQTSENTDRSSQSGSLLIVSPLPKFEFLQQNQTMEHMSENTSYMSSHSWCSVWRIWQMGQGEHYWKTI